MRDKAAVMRWFCNSSLASPKGDETEEALLQEPTRTVSRKNCALF